MFGMKTATPPPSPAQAQSSPAQGGVPPPQRAMPPGGPAQRPPQPGTPGAPQHPQGARPGAPGLQAGPQSGLRPGQPGGIAPAQTPGFQAGASRPAADPDKIGSYMFTDMYLPADPLHPIMVRGLRSSMIGIATHSRGLARLPDNITLDAIKLHELIQRKWAHSDWSREFTVTFEGNAYRCSLIAPPNFDWNSGEGGAFGEEDATANTGTGTRVEWCVRQISATIPSFDDLKMPQWAREDIDKLTDLRGLVLIAGPFASGKTTLASCAFDYWVSKSKDVGIALEDPPEIPMERTTEDRGKIIQIDLLDKSIRMAIKNSRRWSPRYVFLGEVRSSDVSAELLHMAISGPLAVCTIHASDPVQAIVSLFRFAAETMSEDMARAMISSSLHQVFHQEIVNGRAILKTARIHGPDVHLIKAKIGAGNFKGLYEDFDRQVINRTNGN